MSFLLLDHGKLASENSKVNSKKTQKASDGIDSFRYTKKGRPGSERSLTVTSRRFLKAFKRSRTVGIVSTGL